MSVTTKVGPLAVRQRIAGWLIVFAVTQVIRCSTAIESIVAGPSPFTPEGRNLQAAVPSYSVYVVFQLVVAIANSALPVIGLVLLFRRNRKTPTFTKAYLALVVFQGLVEMSALRLMYPAVAAAFQRAGDSLAPLDAARDQQLLVGVRQVAYGGIWLLYWFRSAKVKQLFAVNDIQQPLVGDA